MKNPNTNLSPFHGKPRTEEYLDEDGRVSFIVRPREFTPFGAKVADQAALPVALVGTLGVFILLGYLQILPMLDGWMSVLLGFGMLTALHSLVCWALKTESEMVFTVDQFEFSNWDQTLVFDRRLPHKFALLVHDEAQLEKEKIEQEIQQGIREGKTDEETYSELAYFGQSFHISYEYLGQRNDIATVYGQKEALAIVARLRACDEVMDAQDKTGDGTALTPKDQWDDQPGDIEK